MHSASLCECEASGVGRALSSVCPVNIHRTSLNRLYIQLAKEIVPSISQVNPSYRLRLTGGVLVIEIITIDSVQYKELT